MRTAETFWAGLERSGDCLLWTGYVNVLKQTHCKNGHSFDEHGRIAVRKSGHKYRACRQCGREATARFKGKV